MTSLVSIILESPSHVKDSENIRRERRQRERSARHPGGSPPRTVSQKRRQSRTRLEARRTGRTRSRRRPLRAVGSWERARVQRLRAGSEHQRSPSPDAPPGPPPSCGIAYIAGEPGVTRTEPSAFVRDRVHRRRTRCHSDRALRLRAGSRDGATGAAPGLQGDGARGPLAVIPGCPRSYPNSPGRTRMPAVVPWTSPKVRPGTGRYDRASPRTTARRSGRQPNSAPAEGPPTHGSRAPEATHRRGTRPRS